MRNLLFVLALLPSVAATQPAPVLPPADSIFLRAHDLVSTGRGTAGRMLADSILDNAPPGTPRHADALFWSGALAETDTIAEQRYAELIIEYPQSDRVEDALLRLALLEVARGSQDSALLYARRLVDQRPESRFRAETSR